MRSGCESVTESGGATMGYRGRDIFLGWAKSARTYSFGLSALLVLAPLCIAPAPLSAEGAATSAPAPKATGKGRARAPSTVRPKAGVGGRANPPTKGASSASPTVKGRERWARLSPGERQQIERLYEQLRRLSPEQRTALLERLRSLDSASRREVLKRARARLEQTPLDRRTADVHRELLRKRIEELPEADRERLARLAPEERKRYLASLARDDRERLLDRLPPGQRERARRLPPAEQVRFLRSFRAREVFHDTFRSPREIQRLRSLSAQEVLGLLRPRGVVPPERPGILSEETWERWKRLKPFERTRALSVLLNGEPTPSIPPPAPGPPVPRPSAFPSKPSSAGPPSAAAGAGRSGVPQK